MNLAVKITISGILRDFKLGKHVESPYFNQLEILVRSSTENKIMSQTPPPWHSETYSENVRKGGAVLNQFWWVFKKSQKTRFLKQAP